jgi:hypothetical protein
VGEEWEGGRREGVVCGARDGDPVVTRLLNNRR